MMDDLVRANTECGVLLRPLGTKPVGPESYRTSLQRQNGISPEKSYRHFISGSRVVLPRESRCGRRSRTYRERTFR
jgi:hypothetical protein